MNKSQGVSKYYIFAGSVLALILYLSPLYAIDYSFDPNADSRYDHALDLYNREDFSQAAEHFGSLAEDFPWDARITIFKILQAKALYYAGDLNACQNVLDGFMRDYPNSSFIPACHYFTGKIHYENDNPELSAREFLKAYNLSDNNIWQDVFRSNLIAVTETVNDPMFVRNLLKDIDDYTLAVDVAVVVIEEYYSRHQYENGQSFYDEFTVRYPQASTNERLTSLLQKMELFASQKAVLALFAPLSGEWARFGRMMSNSAQMAMEEYQEQPVIDVELKTYDTFGNSIASAIDAKKLTSQPVSAVIGPLSSSEAVGVAAYADISNVPLICPTASEKGLTSITDMIFQLTPSPERMGQALADFINAEIGIDSVAILAPLDNYGKQVTDGFVHSMLDSGATIFYQKFYPRGTRDFRRFMLELKETLLPDTFVADIFLDEFGDTMEVEEIPLQVPAIFMPAYTSELKLLLPQLRFYKINTILLGTDPYGDEEIISMRESEDNPTLFVSLSYYTPEDTAWMKFNFLYQKEFEEEPERVAAVTYDAVSMVLDCVREGLYTSEDIWQCFRNKQEYMGASGIIRFDAQRENAAVPVYLLTDGDVIRIE